MGCRDLRIGVGTSLNQVVLGTLLDFSSVEERETPLDHERKHL